MSDVKQIKGTLTEVFQNILTELNSLKYTQCLIIDEMKVLKNALEQLQLDLGVHKVKLDLMIDNGTEEKTEKDLILIIHDS